MSILGRLLSSASSTSSNNVLNSNLEDQFTINLLFPGPDILDHRDQIFPLKSDTTIDHTSVDKFDLSTEFDLHLRDVRFIIMQEATSLSDSAHLLYDSYVSSPSHTEKQNTHRLPKTGMSSFTNSQSKLLAVKISSPEIIQRHNSRLRASSNVNRPSQQYKIANNAETELQRSKREYREEVATFSNCIFGNSEILAYKGTGTKVHILPSDTRVPTVASSHVVEGSSSFGRASAQGRKLSKSLSSERDHKNLSTSEVRGPRTTNSMPERKKILITRIFPVPLSKDMKCNNQINHLSGPHYENRNTQPKQNRTPMFAVGLVIKISPTTVPSTASTRGSNFLGSGSLTDQDASSSSYSADRTSWKTIGYEHGSEFMKPIKFSRDSSQIDIVARNWDMIVKTLTHLQAVVTVTISPMLMRTLLGMTGPSRGLNSPKISPSIAISVKRTTEDMKPIEAPRSSAKMVQLDPNCLTLLPEKLNHAVETSCQRIVTGIKAKKVVTGQGRWGIWRDQARAVYGWLDRKDQDFMHILLSAFLGNHTGWVMEMSAVWDRQKSCHHQKDRLNKDENFNLSSRTVIVSNNKVLARRLIFLLSSFLPPKHPTSSDTFECPSAPTSAPVNSTPSSSSATPIFDRDSFSSSMKKTAGIDGFQLSPSFSSNYEWKMQNYSPKQTPNFPIPGSNCNAFKSSASTASTASSVTTLPQFFGCRSFTGIKPTVFSGNVGSLAKEDLHRLKQKSTKTESSHQSKTLDWGNVINGIYSNSRLAYSGFMNSSMTVSSDSKIKDDGTQSKPISMIGQGCHMGTRRSSIHDLSASIEPSTRIYKTKIIVEEPVKSLPTKTIPDETAEKFQRMPNPLGSYESPIKASINKLDGVIDIEVPLPSFLHVEDVVSSQSTFNDISSSNLGCSEYVNHPLHDRKILNVSTNVAGWLPHFSPDFVLQAIPGYNELFEDLKTFLRAEPTPIAHQKNLDNWIDIGSIIIADTRNLTIKRLLYRRFAGSKEAGAQPHLESYGSCCGDFYSAHNKIFRSDNQTEDCFVEETITSAEKKLVETVGRLIYPNYQKETTISESLLRASHHQGIPSNRFGPAIKEFEFDEHKIEIPRNECKRTILNTLEEIVEEIIETQKKGEIENDKNFLRNGVRNRLSVAKDNL